MSDVQGDAPARSQYVEFWNSVLVPKFVRWRHILVGGLTLHSGKIFPSLQVGKGDKVIDAGCGFGDTAIELARLVGPTGSVLAVDCCDGFLEYGGAMRAPRASAMSPFWQPTYRPIRSSRCMISVFRASARNFSRTRWPACATCALASSRAES